MKLTILANTSKKCFATTHCVSFTVLKWALYYKIEGVKFQTLGWPCFHCKGRGSFVCYFCTSCSVLGALEARLVRHTSEYGGCKCCAIAASGALVK